MEDSVNLKCAQIVGEQSEQSGDGEEMKPFVSPNWWNFVSILGT